MFGSRCVTARGGLAGVTTGGAGQQRFAGGARGSGVETWLPPTTDVHPRDRSALLTHAAARRGSDRGRSRPEVR
jgi:hypothetical protein